MIQQGFADRLLHRFALGNPRLRRWWFEQECSRNNHAFDTDRRHVFICGMARSGSTILLNELQASGAFAATCYRHMPFVLAPSLTRWSNRGRVPRHERRHGDAIEIDAQSAEALDGIFWNSFWPRQGRIIQPRRPSPELLQGYAQFIENLLQHSQRERYLTKMNQGIDLIDTIAEKFRHSVVLVPFREPLQQATSLKRQHARFADLGHYETRYLQWLEHHEFGPDHRPFVGSDEAEKPVGGPDTLDYWLEQWQRGYTYLAGLCALRRNLIPIGYEQMAESPELWRQLSRRLDATVRGTPRSSRITTSPSSR